jgi:uncharacterized CHY-type Zn-finger protein
MIIPLYVSNSYILMQLIRLILFPSKHVNISFTLIIPKELTKDLFHTLTTACKGVRPQSYPATVLTRPSIDFIDRGDVAEGLLLPKPGIRAQQAFMETDIERLDDNLLQINNLTSENDQSLSSHDPPMKQLSYSNFQPAESVCAICLDLYTVSDIVSWSSNQRCTHSFHRDCILHWLLIQDKNHRTARARPQATKDDCSLLCPCCRVPFLELCLQTKSIDSTDTEAVLGRSTSRSDVLPTSESAAEETETSVAEINSQDSLSVISLDP